MEQKSEHEQAYMATILESKKLNVTAISSLLNKLQRQVSWKGRKRYANESLNTNTK
jgi:hypothetical protein